MTKIKILLIDPSGSLTVESVDSDLETFQELVGGYIEGVAIPGGVMAYVNDEGLLKGLPHNAVATTLAGRPIVGRMIVFGVSGPNEVDVPERYLRSLSLVGFMITRTE